VAGGAEIVHSILPLPLNGDDCPALLVFAEQSTMIVETVYRCDPDGESTSIPTTT
jgi:hypothetical protein